MTIRFAILVLPWSRTARAAARLSRRPPRDSTRQPALYLRGEARRHLASDRPREVGEGRSLKLVPHALFGAQHYRMDRADAVRRPRGHPASEHGAASANLLAVEERL